MTDTGTNRDQMADNVSEISSFSDSSDEAKKEVEIVEEAIEEIDKPVYTEEDLETLIGFIRNMIFLFDYDEDDFNDDVVEIIKLWLTDPNYPLLFVFYDGDILSASLGFPLCPFNDLMYFMRDPDQLFNVIRFHDDIMFGTLQSDIEGSLLVILEQVYGPLILSTELSENVKANVLSGYNTFMTYLTELHYKLSGFTLLYVPREGIDMDIQEVVLNRSMIKRLESVVIDWTSQIRSTLSDTQHFVPDNLICPADEYSFWLYRHEVLSAIKTQFQNPNIEHILQILNLAQSLYTKPLREVLTDLEKEIIIAESNIPFLKLLVDPCFAIRTLNDEDDLCSQLIYVMHIIRFIGADSSHLSRDECITKLFLYLSNEIVSCCVQSIDINKILMGSPGYGIEICNLKINCCESYKIIYEDMLEHFKKDFSWNLDYATIFNQINAFIQRLCDILEICEAMLIFGRYSGSSSYKNFRFPCNNAQEYEQKCDQVMMIFTKGIEIIQSSAGAVLDINNKEWYKTIAEFRDMLRNLDDVIENLLSNIFLVAENLEEKIDVLVALLNFYNRNSIKESYMRKIAEVWKIFHTELTTISKEVSSGINIHPTLLPTKSGQYTMLKIKFERLCRLRNLLERCRFFPTYNESEETLSLFESCEKQVKLSLKKFNESWTRSLSPDFGAWFHRNLICRSQIRPGLLECHIEREMLNIFNEAHFFKVLGATIPSVIDLDKNDTTRQTFDSVIRVVLYFNSVVSSISEKERLFFKPMIQQTERKLEPLRSKLTWDEDLNEYIDTFVTNVKELLDMIQIYKRENFKISRSMETIYNLELFKLNKSQNQHLNEMFKNIGEQKKESLSQLVGVYTDISKNIFHIYDNLGSNLRRMGESWIQYVRKIDRLLKAAVYNSSLITLKNMEKALTEPHYPILSIEIVLDRTGVVYQPTLAHLEVMLKRLTAEVTTTIKIIPTLCQKFQIDAGENIYEAFLSDEHYLNEERKIKTAIKNTIENLMAFKEKWNVFRPFWSVNRVSFIEKFKLASMTSEAFHKNIEKFDELLNQLTTQSELTICECVHIDAQKLKYAITNHIHDWQSKYIEYLKCVSYGLIIDFNNKLNQNMQSMSVVPKEVEDLKELEVTFKNCFDDIPRMMKAIDNIVGYFDVLEKYVSDILPEALNLRKNIREIWKRYMEYVNTIKEKIGDYQNQFKLSMTNEAASLKVNALEMLKMLDTEMPTTDDILPEEAFSMIDSLMEKLEILKAHEKIIAAKMQLLGIEYHPLDVIMEISRKLESIKLVWVFVEVWLKTKQQILARSYNMVLVDSILTEVIEIRSNFANLANSLLPDMHYPIYIKTSTEVGDFCKTMDIMIDMKQSHLRDRHWVAVQEITQMPNYDREKMLLQEMMEFQYFKYERDFKRLCYSARKEFEIESELKSVERNASHLRIIVKQNTTGTYMIINGDATICTAKQNLMVINGIITSAHRKPFQDEIYYWEETLNYIIDLLEALQTIAEKPQTLAEIYCVTKFSSNMTDFNCAFSTCIEQWNSMMNNFASSNLRKDICANGSEVMLKLDNFQKNIERIFVMLKQNMDEKRQICSRLNLLPDDLFIKMIAFPTNQEYLQHALSYMFENIENIKIRKPELSDKLTNVEIAGIQMNAAEAITFLQPIIIDSVSTSENIINSIEASIKQTLKKDLQRCLQQLKESFFKRVESGWIDNFCYQVCLKSIQIDNTHLIKNAIIQCDLLKKDKPMKMLRTLHNRLLNDLAKSNRNFLEQTSKSIIKKKLNAMIVMEINTRDVIGKLTSTKVRNGLNNFEWLSHIRSYWSNESLNCIIAHLNNKFYYGFESKSSDDPLFITPYTNRLLMTISCALKYGYIPYLVGNDEKSIQNMFKHLSTELAVLLIIFNCDRHWKLDCILRCLNGMLKLKSWVCFSGIDNIPSQILTQIKGKLGESSLHEKKNYVLDLKKSKIMTSFQFFVTSSVLHSRVKLDRVIVRSVEAISPDQEIIFQNILWMIGFTNPRKMANLINVFIIHITKYLPKLCYLWTTKRIRHAIMNLKCGTKVTVQQEALIISGVIQNEFYACLSENEKQIFDKCLQSIFKNSTPDSTKCPKVDLKSLFSAAKLMHSEQLESIVRNIIEGLLLTRQSLIVLGDPCSGKSTLLDVALQAISRYGKNTKKYFINPESIHGFQNESRIEEILARIVASTAHSRKCIILDSVARSHWIERIGTFTEYLNSDLKKVCFDKVDVKIVVETCELEDITPASLANFAIVHVDTEIITWKHIFDSWIGGLIILPEDIKIELQELADEFIDLYLKSIHHTNSAFNTDANIIRSFCSLYETISARWQNDDTIFSSQHWKNAFKMLFFFCCVWSIGANLDLSERGRFDVLLRESITDVMISFPLKGNVYQYFIEISENLSSWIFWNESHLDADISGSFISSVDNIPYQFITKCLISIQTPVLLTSNEVVGKSAMIKHILVGKQVENQTTCITNLNTKTSSKRLREIIERNTIKISREIVYPKDRMNMLWFLDDLHTILSNKTDASEFLRHVIEHTAWIDNNRPQNLKQTQILAAMRNCHPLNTLPSSATRLLNKFHVIYYNSCSDESYATIFSSKMMRKVENIAPNKFVDVLAPATIALIRSLATQLPATPIKPRYQFSLKTVDRILGSMCIFNPNICHCKKNPLLKLWIHECFRETWDLLDKVDSKLYYEILNDNVSTYFEATLHSLCPGNKSPLFCDVMNQEGNYEDVTEINQLMQFAEEAINEQKTIVYQEALEHAAKILRIIRIPKGHLILIGESGSGRQTICHLAARILNRQAMLKSSQTTTEHAEIIYLRLCFSTNESVDVIDKKIEDIFNLASKHRVICLIDLDDANKINHYLLEFLNSFIVNWSMSGFLNSSIFNDVSISTAIIHNLHFVLCLPMNIKLYRNLLNTFTSLLTDTPTSCIHPPTEISLMEISQKFFKKHITFDEPISALTIKKDDSTPIHRKRDSLVQSTEDRLHNSSVDAMARTHTTILREGLENDTLTCWFFELLLTFQRVLTYKRNELRILHEKFSKGIDKIMEATQNVTVLQDLLEKQQSQIESYQHELEAFIENIERQTIEADEQKQEVAIQRVKIGAEEVICKQLADIAEADLAKAMPALNSAIAALDSLNKKDMNEIKSYARPPVKVELVLNAVMILLGKEPTWAESKRQLGEQKFLDTLRNFDKNNITDKTLKIIGGYARNPELEPNKVGIVSKAAKSLILWVRAIENYGKVYKYVGPKIKKMEDANASLLEKQLSLKAAEQKLEELAKKLAELREEYELKIKSKLELEEKARQMALKLQRAKSLVQGLSNEKLRWTETKHQLENQYHNLIGDVFLASGSIVYFGTLSSVLRENIRLQWVMDLEALEIPFNKKFNMFEFFYGTNDLQKWQQNGLPIDSLSLENATILLQTKIRIPLIIDPQDEILQWIKGINSTNNLLLHDINEIVSNHTVNMTSQLINTIVFYNFHENSMPKFIQFLHYLFEIKHDSSDIDSEKHCLSRVGDHFAINFLTNEKVAYSSSLRKKTNMINFVLGLPGLETKLLTIVVEHENPNLEERKETLTQTIIDNKKILVDIEESILRLLNESNIPLLENEELYSTLQVSKQTTDRVNVTLDQDERTRQEIESSRESYRPCAGRSCLLFFVIECMKQINPMYAFSLDWYFTLFRSSLQKCPRSQVIEERTKKIIDFHTYNVFKNVCFGLKPLDRIIFGFLLCVRLLFAEERMSFNEYNFLLHGPEKIDRIEQIENPSPNWISSEQWDNITELDKLPGFLGLAQSFEESNDDWKNWYQSPCPEVKKMPANWEKNLTKFQKNMVVRGLRLDRFEPCMIEYIDINLGKKYTYTDRTSLSDVLIESSAQTPLLLITDSHNNPWSEVQLLAKTNCNKSDVKYLNMNSDSLQDLAYFLKQCVSDEVWLFIDNCQKIKSFIVKFPAILKYLKSIDLKSNFRMWLSVSENDPVPLILLQSSIKFAYHKPIGIQQNMNMLFEEVGEREFEKLTKITYHTQHKKLLFSLTFLHSLLNGRSKFTTLGWLHSYSFELSDFYLARKLFMYSFKDLKLPSKIKTEMTEGLSEIIPTQFIENVCLEIGYGSQFTNFWDRRIYDSYSNEIFHQQFVHSSRNTLIPFDSRFIFPRDGNFQAFKNFIAKQIPVLDGIHVFALNENANIQHLESKSSYILQMLRKIPLDPQSSSSTLQIKTSVGMEYENVKQTIQELLTKLPVCLDYDNAVRIVGVNRTPVSDSLLLEIHSYNEIVRLVRRNLEQTFAILLGERFLDEEYEDLLGHLRQNRVPQSWLRYPTNKQLSDWLRDLKCRVEYFRKWSETGQLSTNVILGYFIKPDFFLSSVLQLHARANDISVTDVDWSITVFATTKPIVKFPIEEGFIARDMYLQNGGWDLEKQCLKEPSILQMSSPMPPIHFRPVIKKEDVNNLDFLCPCYYGINRTQESFVCALYLKTGDSQKAKWVNYNTALSLTN